MWALVQIPAAPLLIQCLGRQQKLAPMLRPLQSRGRTRSSSASELLLGLALAAAAGREVQASPRGRGWLLEPQFPLMSLAC